MAFTALANAQTASLTLGSGAGTPASNVTVNLTLAAGGTQPAALQWTLQYSPADITGVTAALGAAASSAGKSLTCTAASGSAICVIFGLNQSAIADGVVAQLTFALSPGTTSTSSAIQVTQVVLSDSTGAGIPVAVSAGNITIVQPTVNVSALSCNPATLSPGGVSTCVVTFNMPTAGSTVLALSSSSTSVSVPPSVTAAAGATTASFTATAGSFTTDSSAKITTSLNGSTASAALTLTALPQVSAVNCTPATLSPNGTAACVVTLNKAASGSTVITLSSSSTAVSVPPSVTAAASVTTASFTATAGSFTTDSSTQITASVNGSTASASLTLTALPQVSAVSCSPATLSPSGTAACVVTLNKFVTGSAVISLTSSSPSVSVPPSVTAAAGATTASFTATAGSFTTDSSAQITASLNGSTASASLTLTALLRVSAMNCIPATLNPNGKSTCLVTLSKPAPASGAVIALASSSASVSLPASVTAAGGATSVSFTAAAGSFTTGGSAQITASLNGQTQAFSLTLTASAQIQISSVTCSPATFNGGSSSTCKVTLSSAPSSNASILLSSSAASVTVPSTIAITPGHTSVQFTASTTLVDVDTAAKVTASLGSSSQSATLTVIGVRPTALTCSPLTLSAGGSATCTVQLNRAPQTKPVTLLLASSSASITVPQSLSTKNQQTQYSFTARAPKFAAPGPVQLSATYLASAASAHVTVQAPAAPALNAPAKMTTTVGTGVSITAQAADLNGLNVTLSAANLPAGATFTTSPATTGVAGVIQWIPAPDQVGTYSIKLGAQSTAGTTSQQVAIVVTSPVPHIDSVVNAASLSTQQVCSAGSLAIIQGTALQIPSQSSAGPADQTNVTVDGNPAGVTNASATQITFRCPQDNPSKKVTLQVANRFGTSNAVQVVIQDVAPGIFTLDGSGAGQGVIYVNRSSQLAALPDPSFASQAAAPGDTLTLLMTGLPDQLATPSAVRVTIGQIPAEILALAAVPQFPGYQMLTVRVPPNVPLGDSIPVQAFSQGHGAQSNIVTVAIEQADQ